MPQEPGRRRRHASRPTSGRRSSPHTRAYRRIPNSRAGRQNATHDSVERPIPAKPASDDHIRPPFRVLIAVHRPRFRGRAERAAALVGWVVTSLLNKQDPVGATSRSDGPPDIVVLSGDFGRQKDYAIFRALQPWRAKGVRLVGLVDDCAEAPPERPDSRPDALCDVCIAPPYRTAELRKLFIRIYEEVRGEPAPPAARPEAPESGEQD